MFSGFRDNQAPGGDAAGVSRRTELLRAAADGELTREEEVELEAHLRDHPEDRAVIEFERGLRGEVARAAVSEPPAGLRDRVLASAASGGRELSQSADNGSPGALPINGPVRRGAPLLRYALAAGLVLAAAGSIVVVRSGLAGSPTVQQMTASQRLSLVSFLSTQHEECELHADLVGTRFSLSRLDDVPARFASVLGRRPDLGRLEASGLSLLGAGPCAVPGRGRSVRLVLDASAVDPNGQPLVSIYIQQDTAELGIEDGRAYRLSRGPEAQHGAGADVFVWRNGGLLYFFASTSEPAIEVARSALGAPEPVGSI
jgi:anti-sigma factor RsiW